MLAKVVWKTTNKEKVVWMDLIHKKYLKGQSILHYSTKPGDSPMWKGVVHINLIRTFGGKLEMELRSNSSWIV